MGDIHYPDPVRVAVAAAHRADRWGWATAATGHGVLDQALVPAAGAEMDALLAAFRVVLTHPALIGAPVDLLCVNAKFRSALTTMRGLATHVEPLTPDRFSSTEPVYVAAATAAAELTETVVVPPLLAATDGALERQSTRGGFGWIAADGTHRSAAMTAVSVVHTELAAVASLLTGTGPQQPLVAFVDSREALRLIRHARTPETSLTALALPRPVTSTLRTVRRHLAGRDVQFRWVAGHAGHPLNDGAHRLAVLARRAARMNLPAPTVANLRAAIVADTVSAHRATTQPVAAPATTGGHAVHRFRAAAR